MDAKGAPFRSLLEGKNQYVVPLFQRPYTWDKPNWGALWDDLVNIYHSAEGREHFIGSMVTLPLPSNAAGTTKYLLIDGQQRMTTILILLSAIRDTVFQADNSSSLQAEIDESYLRNKFVDDQADTYKLMPTELDRTAFVSTMQGALSSDDHKITRCKTWFLHALKQNDENGKPYDLLRLKNLVISKLVLVSISLSALENPFVIFETLNARGTPLSQADLIRNLFFMRIEPSKHELAYTTWWLPTQREIGEKSLPGFFRHFLLKDGGEVRMSDVFVTMREKYADKPSEEILNLMKEVRLYSTFYQKLLDPTSEPFKPIRDALLKLQAWEVTTAYPLLLKFYALFANKTMSLEEFSLALSYVESYLVRRFVTGFSSRSLNRYFPSISAVIRPNEVVASLVEGMKRYGWPEDSSFSTAFQTRPLYQIGSYGTSQILTSLERSSGHKENPNLSQTTVEHVMPQTLTPEWIQALGPDAVKIHENMLHTIGNLTLSAYNPNLSNSPFPSKKELYSQSNLELNKYICGFGKWDEQSMKQRAVHLSEKALQIWPRPS